MIKLEMLFTWTLGFIIGFALLIAVTAAEFLQDLFELPFDTWEIVKEKYEEIE